MARKQLNRSAIEEKFNRMTPEECWNYLESKKISEGSFYYGDSFIDKNGVRFVRIKAIKDPFSNNEFVKQVVGFEETGQNKVRMIVKVCFTKGNEHKNRQIVCEFCKAIGMEEPSVKVIQQLKKLQVTDIENNEIKNILKKRGIKSLVHVTPRGNMTSILENGILPVTVLQERGIHYNGTDEERFDGRKDCTSLSITKRNSQFIKVMNSDLIEIQIKPEVIFTSEKRFFCPHNAATKSVAVSMSRGILSKSHDLDKMFAETVCVTKSSGERLHISRSKGQNNDEPTSIQAEILFGGIIEPKHINSIIFYSQPTEIEKKKMNEMNIEYKVFKEE